MTTYHETLLGMARFELIRMMELCYVVEPLRLLRVLPIKMLLKFDCIKRLVASGVFSTGDTGP